ncbi:hypothetical protein Tco_0855824 [Tanacetum coccineum]
MDLDFAANENLGKLGIEEAWETIKNFAQGQKEWDNTPNFISEQEVASLRAQAKGLFYGMRLFGLRCMRYMEQNPNKIHWTTVKVILKYLRNTKDMILMYGAKPEAKLKSAKQSTTVMSSTEAEYIVTAKASIEAVWIRKFIDGLGGVMPLNKRYMEMLCDNEPAIAIPNDPKILKGARHF